MTTYAFLRAVWTACRPRPADLGSGVTRQSCSGRAAGPGGQGANRDGTPAGGDLDGAVVVPETGADRVVLEAFLDGQEHVPGPGVHQAGAHPAVQVEHLQAGQQQVAAVR